MQTSFRNGSVRGHTNHHSLYEQNILATAWRLRGDFGSEMSHHFHHRNRRSPRGNVQLAKLIVNSGGAAALVDYVAEAQASGLSSRPIRALEGFI